MTNRAHWDAVYGARTEQDLTWFEDRPDLSLSLIADFGGPGRAVIDIGAGTSRLVDHLLAEGYGDVTVLDLSKSALDLAKTRLGEVAKNVHWIAADITRWSARRLYGVWHDRAVFHFLTRQQDRAAYVAAMQGALEPGGHAIIFSFAENGPQRCSGLPVVRYSPEGLASELEHHAPGAFKVIEARRFSHTTPKGNQQRFQVSVFRKIA
jgi:ubiquinone/menaquinone biosynthesis C-methylase UbiE